MAAQGFEITETTQQIKDRMGHRGYARYSGTKGSASSRGFSIADATRIAYCLFTPGFEKFLADGERPTEWPPAKKKGPRKKDDPADQPADGTKTNSKRGCAGSESVDLPNLPLLAVHFAGKKRCTPREEVEWVHENLHRGDIKPQDAPSAGAWGSLHRARIDKSFRVEHDRAWYKLLPTRSEIEGKDKPEDDGRKYIDLVERLEAEATQAGQ